MVPDYNLIIPKRRSRFFISWLASLRALLFLPLHLLDLIADAVLEFLPGRPVKLVAQFAVVIHLPPAVSSPLTTSHVDHKVPVSL